jgi:GMP synthase-like glutamine amidotransferase
VSLLSSTRACKNQAFRFKSRLVGFQYHIETTPEGIEALLANRKEDVIKAVGPDGEQKIREDTTRFYPRHARLGDKVLQNFVQFLKAYNPLK